MSNQNKSISKVIKNAHSPWRERAKYRIVNRKWLGYSGKIALRILSAIEDNRDMNQKKLAKLADVSPQHVSKIVKGQENLTLQTIAKFSEILEVELITFPAFKYNSSKNIVIIVDANMYQLVNFYSTDSLISSFTNKEAFIEVKDVVSDSKNAETMSYG